MRNRYRTKRNVKKTAISSVSQGGTCRAATRRSPYRRAPISWCCVSRRIGTRFDFAHWSLVGENLSERPHSFRSHIATSDPVPIWKECPSGRTSCTLAIAPVYNGSHSQTFHSRQLTNNRPLSYNREHSQI